MPPQPSRARLRALGYPIDRAGRLALPPAPRRHSPLVLDEQFEALWRLSAHARVSAMYRGELTYAQLCKWAARHPDEVAVVEGELVFIAAHTPELADIGAVPLAA